jgi:hypothetical protein
MGVGPAQMYENQMRYLIQEYKYLNFNDRKLRFTEFIRREADIFAQAIDTANINNVSNDAFNSMMDMRNRFLRELFDTKDVCVIF